MKIGMKFNYNGFECTICDTQTVDGKEYINVCMQNSDKIDYRIMEVIDENNSFRLSEVKNEDELARILPSFLTDEVS